MAKFMIQAVQREGHDGAYRAGKKWPSGAPVEVEVLDQDDDPVLQDNEPIRIGRKSFAVIQADTRLRWYPAGDPFELAKATGNFEGFRKELAASSQEIERLQSKLAAVQAEVKRATEQAAEQVARLTAENDDLRAQLAAATAPAAPDGGGKGKGSKSQS